MQNANGHDFDIAITGMACRFPGAASLEAFWHNLCQGKETLTVFTDEELLAAGVDQQTLRQPGYVKSRGILADIDAFDASFFGYSPREAELMDPQQRFFLECAWQAFEHANCNVQTYQGRVGVFAGSAMSNYLLSNLLPIYGPALLSTRAVMLGNEKDYLPARVSYKLNLSGPSLSVNATCSTALVAVHLACQSLLHGECDMALAGGASLALPQVQGYCTEEEGHLSPDGHCRAFDARASGFVPSNGVGVVILKRLADALADRDCIHAVIKGSAINSDGASKVGFTTPGVEGQTAVVIEALAVAGCAAETISYVETHGTGTDLGDSLEIAALTRAFRTSTERTQFCAIGSVKPNIGHTGTASGIASLIKAVLSLKHRQIPPSLYFEQPNPNIDFAHSPFKVNTTLTDWQQAGPLPRRAAVHSFGNGGTNAHVILEEAPALNEARQADEQRGAHLLVLSARTASALEEQSRLLAGHLSAHPELSLADVAFTLQTSRVAMKHRRALVCASRDEAVRALGGTFPQQVWSGATENEDPPVIFVFPEAQPVVGLGYALYKSEPVYRKYIDECVHFIMSTLGTDIRDILYDETGCQSTASMLNKASIAGPALFMTSYALAKLWMSWGVQPQAMLGVGAGEYVAACLAGTIPLKDVFKLVFLRAQFVEEFAGQFDFNRASLAAVDASLLEKYRTYIEKISFAEPRLPFLSNETGTWITPAQACAPAYWVQHLRQPARLGNALARLSAEQADSLFLLAGPASVAEGWNQSAGRSGASPQLLAPLSNQPGGPDEAAALLTTAGRLWLAGVTLNWPALHEGSQPGRVVLPTYPFERQRYWLGPQPPLAPVHAAPAVESPAHAQAPADASEQPLYPRPELDTPYVAPRNDIERFIAGLYQEFLGLDRVGVDDDFFEFGGGDSLVATRVITRLKQTFQVRLSMRDIFDMPTVADLAQYIAKETSHE